MLKPIRYGGVVAGQEEIDAVTAVLGSQGWASGAVTAEFEAAAAAVQGRAHALFVNSGSSALLLAMSVLPRGSRVAMPALQFPTLYSAAVWCGLEPVLVDVDDSLNLDPALIPPDVDAVAFVHMAGNPTNIVQAGNVAAMAGLYLIEDICEALGASVTDSASVTGHSKLAGSFGLAAAASTHAAHHIATGEGGLVFTAAGWAYDQMRSLRDWGRGDPSELPDYYPGYVFSRPGLNLHASDIQAALGLVQLRRLDRFTAQRHANYHALAAACEGLPLTLPRVDANCVPSWYAFPFLTDERDKLSLHLAEQGIESRPLVAGNMARQPVTGGRWDPAAFPVADDAFRRGLWISVHPSLTAADISRVTAALEEFFT